MTIEKLAEEVEVFLTRLNLDLTEAQWNELLLDLPIIEEIHMSSAKGYAGRGLGKYGGHVVD